MDPSRPSGGPAAQPFRFTGEQLDTSTGLLHLRARQYDAATGRFMSTDPAAPAISDPYVGSYAYVRNRPTVAIDPSGTCLQFAGAGLAAAPATGGTSALAGAGATIICAAVVAYSVVTSAPAAAEVVTDLGETAMTAYEVNFAQRDKKKLAGLRDALRRQREKLAQPGNEQVGPHWRDVEGSIEDQIRAILNRHPHWRGPGDPAAFIILGSSLDGK